MTVYEKSILVMDRKPSLHNYSDNKELPHPVTSIFGFFFSFNNG